MSHCNSEYQPNCSIQATRISRFPQGLPRSISSPILFSLFDNVGAENDMKELCPLQISLLPPTYAWDQLHLPSTVQLVTRSWRLNLSGTLPSRPPSRLRGYMRRAGYVPEEATDHVWKTNTAAQTSTSVDVSQSKPKKSPGLVSGCAG